MPMIVGQSAASGRNADNARRSGNHKHETFTTANGHNDHTRATTASPPPTTTTTNTDDDNYYNKIHKYRQLCGAIVNDFRVQIAINCCIVINSIMMGIGTYSFIDNNSLLNHIWNVCDNIFLIIFTIEMAMQLIYHGKNYFYDGWLVFDMVVITLSWSLNGLQIIRALRIFRTLRVLTRFKALRNLIASIMEVIPSVGAILVLLVLVLYIYAVLCTTLFRNLYSEGVTDVDYFSRLDLSVFTLFQMMTLEWSDIVRKVCTVYPNAWVIFLSYLNITAFILYSLIVAVVCDAVSVAEHAHDDDVADEAEQDDTTKRNRIIISQNERMHGLQERVYEISYQKFLLTQFLEHHKATIHVIQHEQQPQQPQQHQEQQQQETQQEQRPQQLQPHVPRPLKSSFKKSSNIPLLLDQADDDTKDKNSVISGYSEETFSRAAKKSTSNYYKKQIKMESDLDEYLSVHEEEDEENHDHNDNKNDENTTTHFSLWNAWHLRRGRRDNDHDWDDDTENYISCNESLTSSLRSSSLRSKSIQRDDDDDTYDSHDVINPSTSAPRRKSYRRGDDSKQPRQRPRMTRSFSKSSASSLDLMRDIVHKSAQLRSDLLVDSSDDTYRNQKDKLTEFCKQLRRKAVRPRT